MHITWEAQKVDNTRGPNGETVWKRVSDGRWKLFILDLAAPNLRECADTPTVNAHGIEWADLFFDRHQQTIQRPRVDFRDGEFSLADAAI